MNFAIDIVIIIVFLMIVFLAARRGFIKTIMGLVSTVVSLFLAYAYTPVLANYLKDTYIINKIADGISNTLQGFSLDSVTGLFNLEKVAADEPKSLVDMLNRYGTSINSFAEKVRGATGVGEGFVDKVSEDVANPIASQLSIVISFILIFIAALIILKLITLILDAIFKLPVLSFANRLFGVIFGIAEGVLVAYVIAIVFSSLLKNLGVIAPQVFGGFKVEDTYVCKFLLEHNIFDFFADLFK